MFFLFLTFVYRCNELSIDVADSSSGHKQGQFFHAIKVEKDEIPKSYCWISQLVVSRGGAVNVLLDNFSHPFRLKSKF